MSHDGSDQGLEQLGDVSKCNVEVYAKKEEWIDVLAKENCKLIRRLESQTYACRSVEGLQKLGRTLTEMCCDFSNSLYNTPTLATYGRKRSASTKDTPALKKMA